MRRQKTTTCYYKEYTDDMVVNANQNYELPDDYVWRKKTLGARIGAGMIYGVALVFGFFYNRFGLHMHVKNKSVLKHCKKTGYFLFANHTQMVGDVFMPAQSVFPKRIYTVVSPANMGLPVIGKILPKLGALPIPETMQKMKLFMEAVETRIKEKKCVVIYPEAHLWPYCTMIRPYKGTSFRFPVICNAPCYCMTTTYQKRRLGKKPKITVYIDGPFLPDRNLKSKDQQQKLHDDILHCMQERSKKSTYDYIRYERRS